MDIVKSAIPAQSNSKIRRLFEQGAVKINDQKILIPTEKPSINKGDILKVGKTAFFELIPPGNE